jgi:hypothetical protein
VEAAMRMSFVPAFQIYYRPFFSNKFEKFPEPPPEICVIMPYAGEAIRVLCAYSSIPQ